MALRKLSFDLVSYSGDGFVLDLCERAIKECFFVGNRGDALQKAQWTTSDFVKLLFILFILRRSLNYAFQASFF